MGTIFTMALIFHPAYFIFIAAVVVLYTPIRKTFKSWSFSFILLATVVFIIVAETLKW